MKTFPLSSENATLLMEYEKATTLNKLAEAMKRDTSVVSRNLKKLSEELPVVEKVPVKLSPSISKVNTLVLPTWSMLKFEAEPETVDAVVELPTVFPSPSCNTSNTNEAPACVTYILFVAIEGKLIIAMIKKVKYLILVLLHFILLVFQKLDEVSNRLLN